MVSLCPFWKIDVCRDDKTGFRPLLVVFRHATPQAGGDVLSAQKVGLRPDAPIAGGAPQRPWRAAVPGGRLLGKHLPGSRAWIRGLQPFNKECIAPMNPLTGTKRGGFQGHSRRIIPSIHVSTPARQSGAATPQSKTWRKPRESLRARKRGGLLCSKALRSENAARRARAKRFGVRREAPLCCAREFQALPNP